MMTAFAVMALFRRGAFVRTLTQRCDTAHGALRAADMLFAAQNNKNTKINNLLCEFQDAKSLNFLVVGRLLATPWCKNKRGF
jgi:hypothetical protein